MALFLRSKHSFLTTNAQTPRPLLLEFDVKNHRGGHNVPPLSNRVKAKVLQIILWGNFSTYLDFELEGCKILDINISTLISKYTVIVSTATRTFADMSH